MKKIIFTICLLMAAMFLTAQEVPQAINFQAIARDANSEIMANTQIMIQLTILDGAPDGTQIYREIRSLMTNNYGSFSFQIGRDPYISLGEFADIDWAGGRKFLKIDYDPTASLSFNLSLGTIEFVSVPYAFAAGTVSYIDATGANDGDVLAYNATTGRFEPVTMSGASGGITEETDPTVPDWAKADTKPTYDYSEIENTPEIPTIPTNVSAFENDANYLTSYTETDPTVPEWAKAETKPTYDYSEIQNTPTAVSTFENDANYITLAEIPAESQTLADVAALGNSVNSQLKNVTDPTDAQDAVTKAYVDALIAQLQAAIDALNTTSTETTGTLNGHEWIDLGLPSGLLWATCNIGATNPEDYGNYYAWGETSTKETYSSSNYTYTDNPTTLPASADAATANWGAGWRMPTKDEEQEMYNNCDRVWTTQNGINGMRFTSRINGNSIFIPAGGGYDGSYNLTGSNGHSWSSTIGNSSDAWYINFGSAGCGMSCTQRYCGRTVRPVCLGANTGSETTVILPSVTTSEASNITATGATLSGNVTSDGGATVTARGFLYGTGENNLTEDVQGGSGTDSFTANLTGLTPGTTYYYKAYATNSAGTAYGEVQTFTTISIPVGAISGLFSVSENKQVQFSKGNLQYQASSNMWRFAENQYDVIGNANSNISSTYSGWIDLFGWGTSGYDNKYPWMTSMTQTDYGDNQNNIENTNYDWGQYNPISNGGNQVGLWRTPSSAEMDYMIYGRANAESLYSMGLVNRRHGLIILPDNCILPEGITFTPAYKSFTEDVNNFSLEQWNQMEAVGAVFLPVAGVRNGTSVSEVDESGYYWSTDILSPEDGAREMWFGRMYIYYNPGIGGAAGRHVGYSVRLVTSDNNTGNNTDNNSSTPTIPSVTTSSASSITSNGATLSGNVTSDGGATVTARGFLYGTNESNLTQNLQGGSGTGDFTANLTGLSYNTIYYYKAYATNSAGTAYGDVMSFTTSATTGTLNGYDWVDLGLPSGTRWATCNVGASTPEGYGDYFAWGETEPKETYNMSTYRYYDGSNFTKYTGSDSLTTLEASDDASTANWGSGWRMPTYEELNELQTNCTVTWTTQNGVNGRLFTGPNGNSIFLPAAGDRYVSNLYGAGSYGYIWSSSLYSSDTYGAWRLYFDSGYCDLDGDDRYKGRSVRAVCVSSNNSDTSESTLTDSRDGQTYATVTIGSQTWMAENLRYEGDILLGSTASNTTAYRYYPNNNSDNVASYGYLYNWTAAMNGASSSESNPSGVQGICPDGWHFPSHQEWTQLVETIEGENVGAQLAGHSELWQSGALIQANNFGTSGFDAVPAGCNGNNPVDLGIHANLWSSTEDSSSNAWYLTIWNYGTEYGQGPTNKSLAFSVRCVRNN